MSPPARYNTSCTGLAASDEGRYDLSVKFVQVVPLPRRCGMPTIGARWLGTAAGGLLMFAKSGVVSLCCVSCILAWELSSPVLNAATLHCNLDQYQRLPGLAANVELDGLLVQWDGERNQKLRARFA